MACRGCSSQCPGNNSVLSMRGVDMVRGDLHVAEDASRFLEDGISRQRDNRRFPPKRWLNCSFRTDCATHVLNIPDKCEAFVLCGCAEPNDPPQRCWIGGQVDRSILL
ncbi:hypothetical protein TcG_10799 [Trypanosoma cruzi]|nr:hypothetical protein TcG_10799 [Trypanosoma cruzi]